VVSTPTWTNTSLRTRPVGSAVGTESFTADAAGYKALLIWLEEFGQVTKVGVEGTGSYGVGLSRFLRRRRRGGGSQSTQPAVPAQPGKSDPSTRSRPPGPPSVVGLRCGQDQGRSCRGHPGLGGGQALARQARVKAIVQMRHLGITALTSSIPA